METERGTGRVPVSVVVFDVVGMLAKLTGITGWTEFQGPRSRCGIDYWYEGTAPSGGEDGDEGDGDDPVALQAYVNIDQNRLLSVYAKDEANEDPEDTYAWRAETDLDDPGNPYAAFVKKGAGPGRDG